MAESVKDSFVVRTREYECVRGCTTEQKAQLFDAFFQFHLGEEVCISDPVAKMAFNFFKSAFEENAKRYEDVCQKRRDAVNKRHQKQQDTNVSSDVQADTKDTNVESDIQKDTKLTNVESAVHDSTKVTNVSSDVQADTKDTNVESDIQTSAKNTSAYKSKICNDLYYDNDCDCDCDNDSSRNINTPPTPPLGGACVGEVIDDPNTPPSPKAKGKCPTVTEVAAYCNARGNGINPHEFCDYYTAQGWKQNNGRPIVDWQAAVRNWENRRKHDIQRNTSRVQFPTTDAEARSQHNRDVCNRVLRELEAEGAL